MAGQPARAAPVRHQRIGARAGRPPGRGRDGSAAAAPRPGHPDPSDALVDRLLGGDRARPGVRDRAPAARGGSRAAGGRRGADRQHFATISAEVERQYLRAVYHACDGDLDKMASELLGPKGNARQVHLRLNQLGLKLRELRAAGAEDGRDGARAERESRG